jgi:hypothetical protein
MADTVRKRQKLVVVGAGPVGSLAALYAAARGDEVEIYELRGGRFYLFIGIGNIRTRPPSPGYDCAYKVQCTRFKLMLCATCLLAAPPCTLHLMHNRCCCSWLPYSRMYVAAADQTIDLRDPSTVPLNFTKSINLALSERGIAAMRHSNREELINNVLRGTIPMHGRMIHGRDHGQLWEAAQAYDVHGRVSSFFMLRSCESSPTQPIGHQCCRQKYLEQRPTR